MTWSGSGTAPWPSRGDREPSGVEAGSMQQAVPVTAPERPPSLYRSESKSIFIVVMELFFSRWMLICGIFFAASFWSYLTLERAPDTYDATGQVLIQRGNIDMLKQTPILRQHEEIGSEGDIP